MGEGEEAAGGTALLGSWHNTASWTNLKLHYLKFHLQSAAPKGVASGYRSYKASVGESWSRAEGEGGRRRSAWGRSSLSLSLLGHLAFQLSPALSPLGTQLAAQALFINQIKFIWPPQQSYAPFPLLPTSPPYIALLILCLPLFRGERVEGGEAGSRRCQLPISWAFFNILNCLAECVAPQSQFPPTPPQPPFHCARWGSTWVSRLCPRLFAASIALLLGRLHAVFAAVSCAARASFIKKQLQCYGQFDARCSLLCAFPWAIHTHTHTQITDLKRVYARRHHHQPRQQQQEQPKRAHPPAKTVAAAAQFELALFTLLLCCSNTL